MSDAVIPVAPVAPVSLSAADVRVRIDGRAIIDGVDMQVDAGSVVGLVGPNGSGKSTLLRALVGLGPRHQGSVHLGDLALESLSARRRARLVAFVAQEEEMPSDLLVHEYVALGRLPHARPWSMGRARDDRAVDKALDAVGMAALAHSPVDNLSGGERRRVVLARGLAQDCGLVVLDEPTNHLDIRHQLDLLGLLRRQGRTILMAMHDLNLAAAVCDRVYVLHEGKVLAHGAPEVALSVEVLAEVFGVQAFRLENVATGRTHLVFEDTLARVPRGEKTT
jgi:iron complex transport system ATP-binding protein